MATESEVGSPEWFARRDELWRKRAQHLVLELEDYEENHPRDSPCLATALKQARDSVQKFTPESKGEADD